MNSPSGTSVPTAQRPSSRRERLSFGATCFFAVAFLYLCVVDGSSNNFAFLLPLPVISIIAGPRAYRVAGIACLVFLLWRGAIQLRREHYRETRFIEDSRIP